MPSKQPFVGNKHPGFYSDKYGVCMNHEWLHRCMKISQLTLQVFMTRFALLLKGTNTVITYSYYFDFYDTLQF